MGPDGNDGDAPVFSMTRQSQPIAGPVLYLDFDGVLHPDEIYRIRGRIVLRCDGMNLFEWAPLLVDHLEPYPDPRIILSTSWIRTLSLNEARAWLPVSLGSRVIGATGTARWISSGGITYLATSKSACMQNGTGSRAGWQSMVIPRAGRTIDASNSFTPIPCWALLHRIRPTAS
jgi:hypothetical protein